MSEINFPVPLGPVPATIAIAESTHSKDRRSYQYNRSMFITTQRFQKEFEGLTVIIGQLGKIIELSSAPEVTFAQSDLDTLKSLLGEYRLFIDYRNSKGEPYCGVRAKPEKELGIEFYPSDRGSSPYAQVKAICHKIDKKEPLDEIIELFDDLLRCVNCRLRAIETGKRDTRKINKRMKRRFFPSIESDKYECLDTQCSKYRNKTSKEEE